MSSGPETISTPDRRVRVFVSSTLGELADERLAARSAITRLHLTPVMFEVGARSHPARELYRAYLEQSDVFVGIYWQRYGWVAPGEDVSGLEDEYRLAGDRPKLLYVKAGTEREPGLRDLLDRIRDDDGVSYKHFTGTDELADLLADDLAVLLTERFAAHAPATAAALGARTLPSPPTAIVGRDDEIATVLALLSEPAVRLVTLLGPGGIGKTRLALEIARRVSVASPAPVSFIDLSAVRDPLLWPEAVTSALGIRPEGTRPVLDLLIDRVRDAGLLLVLDNVEQIVPAAPDLAVLLAACPGLTVLVTSRIVLGLRGEREIALAPLATPPPPPAPLSMVPVGALTPAAAEAPDVDSVAAAAAVRLLVARARQVRPEFAVTPANAAAVAELSRRLEGIPLALELAAVQLRLLTPAALVRRLGQRLDQSLDLLTSTVDTPDRQRTLRATIAWSAGLLTASEQSLLARLSVFTGTWTLEAAEAVGTLDGDLDALATLSSLVAQSLIRTDESDPDEPRFGMLGTIRAYAREQLDERGEVDATIARLTRYLLDLVASLRDDLQGSGHREAAERLDRERDEIRSAMGWALQNDDAATVGLLLTPLFTYWFSRGLLPMTRDVAERGAALPSAATIAPYAAALLSGARGMAAVMVGRTPEAEALLLTTLDGATALGIDRLRAYALLGLGWATIRHGTDEASRRLDDAVTAFRGTGDRWGLAVSLATRGQLALLGGDPVGAREMHLDALSGAEEIDNDHLRAGLLDMLGIDALAVGDLPDAFDRLRAAASLHVRLFDHDGSAYGLSGLAGVALARRRPEAAARLIGASRASRSLIGIAVWPGMAAASDLQDAAVALALGPGAFAAAVAEGALLRLPEAFACGLAAAGPDEAVPGPRAAAPATG